MNTRTAGFIVWPIFIIYATALGVRFFFSTVLNRPTAPPRLSEDIAVGLAAASFLTVALVLAWRRPQNRIGWLLLAVGSLLTLREVARQYALYALYTRLGGLPGGELAVLLSQLAIILALLALAGTVLLFPTGRLLSSRWRWIGWAMAIVWTVTTILGVFRPTAKLDMPPVDARVPNPLAITGPAGPVVEGLQNLSYLAFLLLIAAAAVSTVLRYRRSRGEERLQLKWFAYGASLSVLAIIGRLVLSIAGIRVSNAYTYLLLTPISLTIGVAILKYRLYAIDLAIKRTLVYVPLTAILAGLYIAGIGVGKALFSELIGVGSDAAVAFTTLVVVAALTPLRNQIQALVDKRFKEAPDPKKELAQLAQQTRSVFDVLDSEQHPRRLLALSALAVDARGAAVHLGTKGGAQPVFTYGEPDETPQITLPLRYNGVDSGFVTFGPRRSGAPYTHADRQVLEDSAQLLAQVLALRTA